MTVPLPIIVIGDPFDESTWVDPETGDPFDRAFHQNDGGAGILIIPSALLDADDADGLGHLLDAMTRATLGYEATVAEYTTAIHPFEEDEEDDHEPPA